MTPATECGGAGAHTHAPDPPICMSAESAAKVGGAAPKDRYERELVLIRSSVRCQAKTADLLPPRTRVTGGSAGARFVLRSATTSRLRPFILARCRLPACWPRGQRQARARACAAAARALAWSKKWPARGSLFADGVKIRSWVTIIQRLGCPASQPFRRDSRVLARQLVRSSFLFRLADIFMSARRPGGCPGPEVPDARAEGRLSPTAVCHISAPRPRRAVPPGSSRGGHGGGRKAGPEPLCMNAPGRRAIGCVAFQPAAGTITSVASWLRGGDPDERPGQMEPRR